MYLTKMLQQSAFYFSSTINNDLPEIYVTMQRFLCRFCIDIHYNTTKSDIHIKTYF